ncbi:hypothetical protein MAPG_06280 [Magnaporthiopsis poae ATCC 64411]|uniref:Uncharacterized protein n=1 Tax=Magnaporthiopsis poae (strain ATCC 64411 / 73-15) TaxID=644358 RepID=A0A0C4E1L6_MAGP6|nr:hypothetical protein MAPG_06280 [Magnaporthiopsis poae ATCC 64411]
MAEIAAGVAVAKGVVDVIKVCHFVYTQLRVLENAPSDFKDLRNVFLHMEKSLQRADAARSEARERHNKHAHDALIRLQTVVTRLFNELSKKLDFDQTLGRLGSDNKATVCWARVAVYIDNQEYKELRTKIFYWCLNLDNHCASIEASSWGAPSSGAVGTLHG